MSLDEEGLSALNGLSNPKKKKGLRRSSEDSIQVSIVSYLKNKYHHVVFRCAPENIRMSIGQVMKAKRSGLIMRSLPDVEIFEPVGQFHGLFLELKKDDFRLRKGDGSLYKNEHVSEQLETLLKLKDKGYAVSFGVGYKHSVSLIDDYMAGKNIEHLIIL